MKKIFLSILVVFGLFSCEDSLEDTNNEIEQINALDPDRSGSSSEYTISDEDYEAIVPTNDLDFFEGNSAFISEEDAIDRIPGILVDRFADEQNDEFVVNYRAVSNEFVETAMVIDSLANVSASLLENSYTLESDDYPESELNGFLIENQGALFNTTITEVVQNQFPLLENGNVVNLIFNLVEEETFTILEGDDVVYDFNNAEFSGWTVFDISGPQTWNFDPEDEVFIEVSGFDGSQVPNEDWLVSPSVDLSVIENPRAQIIQELDFADDTDLLEILISEEFDGDVEADIWTKLDINIDSNTPFVTSDELDLSDYANSTVNFAFRYRSTDEESGRWRIQNFSILGDLEEGIQTVNEFVPTEISLSLIMEDDELVEYTNAYRLVSQDYDAMGEVDGPGRFNNFSNSLLPENFIPQFLAGLPQFQFAQINDIVYVGYDFFISFPAESLFPAWINTEEGWKEYNADNFLGEKIIEFQSTFVYQNKVETSTGEVLFDTYVVKTATPYTLTVDDYDLIVDELTGVEGFEAQVDNLDFFGNFNRNGGDTNWDDDQLEIALAIVLSERFPDAAEGDQFDVTYDFFRGGTSSESRILELMSDGEFTFPQ